MVTETGDYSQLIAGYDLEAGDTQFFDKPNMEQLGFIGEQAGLDTLALGQNLASTKEEIGIGRDALTENLRSATSAYDVGGQRLSEGLRSATSAFNIGSKSASLQAGRGITGSRQQGAAARSRSGLATSGTIAGQQRAASKGIWQDYNQQQKTLSNQMTSAQSAFDLGTKDLESQMTGATSAYDLGTRTQDLAFTRGQNIYDRGVAGAKTDREAADLDKRKGKSSFWEGLESDFYTMAGNL